MLLLFALLAVLGGPLVFVIWETINQVLTGNLGAVRLEWFLPAVPSVRLRSRLRDAGRRM
jgi:hypothetical protein